MTHLLAAACEQRFELWNLAFKKYAEGFESFSQNDFRIWPPGPGLILPEQLHAPLRRWIWHWANICPWRGWWGVHRQPGLPALDLSGPEFLHVRQRHQNLVLWGVDFTAGILIARHGDTVRSLFRPAVRVSENIRKWRQSHPSLAKGWVGLHVRRGDYREYEGGRHFFSLETYRGWLDFFSAQGKTVVVCGDDARFCAELASGGKAVPGPGGIHEDLFMLAESHGILGPPSTFSRWAAWWGRVPLGRLDSGHPKPRNPAMEMVPAP